MMFLVCLLFYLLHGSDGQFSFYEGDLCRINNFHGRCKLLENCPKVYEEYVRGKTPAMICGFIGQQVVVCCPEDVTTETTITASTSENSQNKSSQCVEYTSVSNSTTMPMLNETENQNSTSNCSRTVYYVVGGEKAKPRKYRHMAAIGFAADEGLKWLCGGTLISDRFILTAAHCLFSSVWGPAVLVRLGDLNLKNDNDDANPQEFRILQRITHPDYQLPRLYHDIGLIEIDGTLQFNPWIAPACLPTADTIQDEYGIAIGWGKTDWIDENGSDDLMEVMLKIVPNERCNKFYAMDKRNFNHGVVSNWQICAGDQGKDTCQGDSGGPLIVVNEKSNCLYDVIGITSVGKLCGSSQPGIYTRVSHYVEWIQKIVWPQALVE